MIDTILCGAVMLAAAWVFGLHKWRRLLPPRPDVLCRDCRWARGDRHASRTSALECVSPSLGRSPVTGAIEPVFCSIARGFYGPFTACGPAAAFFEPRPPAPRGPDPDPDAPVPVLWRPTSVDERTP